MVIVMVPSQHQYQNDQHRHHDYISLILIFLATIIIQNMFKKNNIDDEISSVVVGVVAAKTSKHKILPLSLPRLPKYLIKNDGPVLNNPLLFTTLLLPLLSRLLIIIIFVNDIIIVFLFLLFLVLFLLFVLPVLLFLNVVVY